MIRPLCESLRGVGMTDKCAGGTTVPSTAKMIATQALTGSDSSLCQMACFKTGPGEEDVEWWVMMRDGSGVLRPSFKACGVTVVEDGVHRFVATGD